MSERKGLGRYLTKDKNEQGHNYRDQDKPFFGPQPPGGQIAGDSRGSDINKVVAHQDGAQQVVGPLEQALKNLGPLVTLTNQMSQSYLG